MIWMDMMLERNKYPGATATCPADEVESIQKSLHPKTVMVDWQYRIYEAPISTMMSLKDTGYDVMGAPWHDPTNYTAFADTIAQQGFFGIMMTTWHLLQRQMHRLHGSAKLCGVDFAGKGPGGLFRKANFEGDRYEAYGWSPTQLPLE